MQWEEQIRVYKEQNIAAKQDLVVMAERVELLERTNKELLAKQNDEVKPNTQL